MKEDITLKQIVDLILREKIIILAVTITAVIVSGFYSYFIIKPVYEAKVTFLIKEDLPHIDTTHFFNTMQEVTNISMSNPETCQSYLKDPDFLSSVIEELNLRETYDVDNLGSSLHISWQEEDTFYLISRQRDPRLAADIANTAAMSFIDYVKKQESQVIEVFIDFVLLQKEKSRRHLDDSLKELNAFLVEPGGLLELGLDIDSKKETLISLKSRLLELELKQDLDITLEEKDSVKKLQLENNIDQLQTEVKELQMEYMDKQITQEVFQQELDSHKSDYLFWAGLYAVVQIVQSHEISKYSLTITAPASAPEYPIAGNIFGNISTALVLGLILGVCLAFFRKYWQDLNQHK
ncbi:Wzz/FepE/Etk N-terminal domain-containing protein [Candidatus Contubernalis alkaliaceticus]|uniref:Wzz/FepE/Etk N-terminal domain-containing protein n=1 Tax=Candidatus Contubernalis alkaliaceticus TaxID=338645 RepID=UPI001F4BE022|nr:Wzz/FepE/Etk N-terminal domain-containing protein [Candidatus Contubernalis alkalaceticus]UNC93613.1 hypothetical protein HUE98_16925 [Candidatus Contubernalis alkalaceticus]